MAKSINVSRSIIIDNYKSFFEIENMELGEDDHLMIDWAEQLVNDILNHRNEISEKVRKLNEMSKGKSKWCEKVRKIDINLNNQ